MAALMSSKNEYVKKELMIFLARRASGITLSSIDDIVLDYLVGLLESLGTENAFEENFDVDDFTEIMEAYLPGFAVIKSVEVYDWMFMLTDRLKSWDNIGSICEPDTDNDEHCGLPIQCTESDNESEKVSIEEHLDNLCEDTSAASDLTLGNLLLEDNTHQCEKVISDKKSNVFANLFDNPDIVDSSDTHIHNCPNMVQVDQKTELSPIKPKTRKPFSKKQRHRERQSSSRTSSTSDIDDSGQLSAADIEDRIQVMSEMFPTSCTTQISNCIQKSKGDMEKAVQLMLSIEEHLSTVEPSTQQANSTRKKKTAVSLDDSTVREHIIQRYSYVDVDEEKRKHVPLLPKQEPKKLLMYRDGQVVSTKGAKFTEVKKENAEEMKKTYINLKPARQYRFH